MKIESFVFYRDWDPSKREDALKELRDHNIHYIFVSRGFSLLGVYSDDKVADEAREFIELAYKKYGIRSIVPLGRGKKRRLFIDREFVREQSEAIAGAVEKLKELEGFYAIYLDDEPYLTWDFSVERVRDEFNDLFEKETGYRLPDEGRVKGRWDYETALAFCKWVGRKYVEYLRALITAYKKICSRIKSLINFYLPSILPSVDAPVDVYGIIETVDLISHDIYPGWHYYYCSSLENMVAFQTKFLRCLTDKPLWTILQGHRIMLGYAPTLEQIEKWALDAVECGSDYVGWYAAEHDYLMSVAVPIKAEYTRYGCPERWKKMLEVSKKITELEKKTSKAEVAIFASYDSILTHGYRPLIYAFITLYKNAGIEVDFITEKHVEKNSNVLEKYRCIFLGYTPVLRKSLLPIFEKYVEKGGLLVACCSDLRFDEKSGDLSEWKKKLFGVAREKVFWKEDSVKVTGKVPKLRDVELKGFWERRAILETSGLVDVLGVWSSREPAVISKKIGGGKTIYIGTRPYLANCIKGEGKWVDFVKAIIESK